jgi:DNA-directed RNA polymerase I, II, and III subunit RPABC2
MSAKILKEDEKEEYSDVDSYVSESDSGVDSEDDDYSVKDEEEESDGEAIETTEKMIGLEENDSSEEEEDEDEEEDSEEYLQKLDEHYRKKVIENHHPELKTLNYEEIEMLTTVIRDKDNLIIDPLHRTIPILSRYEKARILGERAKQLNMGAKSFIEVDETVIDGYLIALKELEQKRIPFIVQRPLPNGGSEYWRLSDLEILS